MGASFLALAKSIIILLTKGKGGTPYNVYVLLNEIQMMFPQLAKQPADFFTDHLLNNQRLVVLR